MQLNSFLFFYFFFIISSYGQTTWVCSGQVVDSQTNEPLVGANVYTLSVEKGTVTDAYGRYSLSVKLADKALIASYIGYESDTCLNLINGCYFELKPLELKEVIVRANQPELQKKLGQFTPTMEQISSLPTLLGDIDIMKSMTLLPGVSGGVEGSSGLLVRGGNLSHNLVILDGTPVYNSTHLFGFMSAFNPVAIKNVTLYKGGFPAQYGGRLASVLDITMKDGSMRKRATDLSIGLVNSSFMTEGPIWRDKISYMIAGRMLNLSPILGLGHAASGETASYWVYDFNGKVKYKLSKKQSLYLSYFQGQDNFRINEIFESSKYKWGNSVVSLRYNNQISRRVFLDAGLYYNKYAYQATQESTSFEKNTERFRNASGIDDLSAKLAARWVFSSKYRMRFGVELSQKSFIPVNFSNQLIDSLGGILYGRDVRDYLLTNDFVYFLENDVVVSRKIKMKIGGRGIVYKNNGYFSNSMDLRTSLTYEIGQNGSIKFAFDEMNQPFHLLNSIGSSTPNEVWIPSIEKLPLSKATQLSLGFEKMLPRQDVKISIEAYYKRMKNLVRYKPGVAYVFIQKNQWQENVLAGGDGKAYGVEFFANKSKGRFTGWLGYTLSWSQRKYSGTNRGKWFAANYERRHDIELTANYKLTKKWKLAGTFVFQTGRPLTLPSGFYLLPDEPFGHRYNIVFDEINDSRTKVYHRLDISASRQYVTKRNREAMWTFGVYNVYARNNPFSYRALLSSHENGIEVDPRMILYQKSWFNFVPSINYSIKF